MKSAEVHGTKILILGYGKEGKSVEKWFHTHYPECTIHIADKQSAGSGYLDALASYDTVVRSPGIPERLPEIQQYMKSGGHVTSATNIFFSVVKGTTIGITGTKGKSTTTSLIAHILSAHFSDVRLAGNIGYPMLNSLESSTQDTKHVLELSSHQLLDCRYSPHIAVLLAIVPEHLDYYPDLSTYANAKANIFRRQRANDSLVYNPDHTLVHELAAHTKSRKFTYVTRSDDRAHTNIQNRIITLEKELESIPVIPLSEIPLLGNIENALAAVTVSDLMGVPPRVIASAIRSFQPLPHRLEHVGVFRGIRFYNDSLATIPEATIHALESLGRDVSTLIAGGYDRHLQFDALGAYLRQHPVQTLILFPDTGKVILDAIGMSKPNQNNPFMVHSMEEAVRIAFDRTPPGKICLLSPASASYNLFKSYEDRGNQFKEQIRLQGQ